MPNLSAAINTLLGRLAEGGQQALLSAGLKGLEKESLRIGPDGMIARTPHPLALGSALTHPEITTDYSEALLELITPPFQDPADTLAYLDDVHRFVHANLDGEILLGSSMPCGIDGDDSIPIARYGDSNIGRMKYVYRLGLAYRYGRTMQAIAGIHFNYSVPEKLWPVLQELAGDTRPAQAFIADAYFGMIRNILRHGWLVLYLFGASPGICREFFTGRESLVDQFEQFDDCTLYKPYATSLRMSDIGYKNNNQAGLRISFNSLAEYVDTLSRAIATPSPDYERIGVKVGGEYRQLNANVLQIENEYYNSVRPKQITLSGEKPTLALKKRGIRYVELRSVDLSPFHPAGIDLTELRFLEAFMLYCLLEPACRSAKRSA
ncbi:glutamate--cysteine ligase, partial [Methylogaea oryzae]|uniref:glutamate--cysteine ligase n=1 Tax=Methylogaea oryzae TaxID=1295382 RepID=UPI0009E9CD34